MQIPTKVVFDHAETLGQLDPEFQQVIDRIQKKIVIPEDGDRILEMLEALLPDSMTIFPEEADTYTDNEGHITFEVTAYKIDGAA